MPNRDHISQQLRLANMSEHFPIEIYLKITDEELNQRATHFKVRMQYNSQLQMQQIRSRLIIFREMNSLQPCKAINNPHWEVRTKLHRYPTRRWGHSAVIHDKKLVVYGGKTGRSKEPVYRINCETYECEALEGGTPPVSRESHSCSLFKDKFIVWGGCHNEQVLNDCSEFVMNENGGYWANIPQFPKIKPRESHASTVLKNKFILIYGGSGEEDAIFDDFYVFSVETQIWYEIKNIKGLLQSKSGGSLERIGDLCYYFGGQIGNENQYTNDIYKLSFTHFRFQDHENPPMLVIEKIEIQGKKPPPRSCHASVAYKGRYLLILGGEGASDSLDKPATLFNDFWCFDTVEEKWCQISTFNNKVFKPRCSFTATLYRNRLLIFGGLVSIQKNFKSSDELLVLWLEEDPEVTPVSCNICKFNFFPPPESQLGKPKTKFIQSSNSFQMGMNIFNQLSRLIRTPNEALTMILESFERVGCSKLQINLNPDKSYLLIRALACNFTSEELDQIRTGFQFESIPVVENNPYLKDALSSQIRSFDISNFSSRVKLASVRLGKTFVMSNQVGNEIQLALVNQTGVSTSRIDFESAGKDQENSVHLKVIQDSVEQFVSSSLFFNQFNSSRIEKKENEFSILITDLEQGFDRKSILQLSMDRIVTIKTQNQNLSHFDQPTIFDINEQLSNSLFQATQMQLLINEKPVSLNSLESEFCDIPAFQTEMFHKFIEIKLNLSESEQNKGIYYCINDKIVGKYPNSTKYPIKGFFKLPDFCPLNFIGTKLESSRQVDSAVAPIVKEFEQECRKRRPSVLIIDLEEKQI